MFPLAIRPGHCLLHPEGDALPHELRAPDAAAWLASSAPCRPPVAGLVYGCLLNDRAALDALGDAMHAAPYKAPPAAPVLYLKPRNTLAGHRARVAVPGDGEGVEAGISLGIVIGRTATRVRAADALDHVAGYTIVGDLSVPHRSVYRPSIRYRARDRFCVIGPAIVARDDVPDTANLGMSVAIDGKPVFTASTATFVRGVAQLIADVTDFMTLSAGDVLTLGVPHGAPVAHAGDEVTMTLGTLAPLCMTFDRAPDRTANDPEGETA